MSVVVFSFLRIKDQIYLQENPSPLDSTSDFDEVFQRISPIMIDPNFIFEKFKEVSIILMRQTTPTLFPSYETIAIPAGKKPHLKSYHSIP